MIKEAQTKLGIKPFRMEDKDPRPMWTVSVITDLFNGGGETNEERRESFLEMLQWTPGVKFPMEGTQVVAQYLMDNPEYTKLLIKVRSHSVPLDSPVTVFIWVKGDRGCQGSV